MNAKQRTKRRAYAKLGRGFCKGSYRVKNVGVYKSKSVRHSSVSKAYFKFSTMRVIFHAASHAWRMASREGGWK